MGRGAERRLMPGDGSFHFRQVMRRRSGIVPDGTPGDHTVAGDLTGSCLDYYISIASNSTQSIRPQVAAMSMCAVTTLPVPFLFLPSSHLCSAAEPLQEPFHGQHHVRRVHHKRLEVPSRAETEMAGEATNPGTVDPVDKSAGHIGELCGS